MKIVFQFTIKPTEHSRGCLFRGKLYIMIILKEKLPDL